MDNRNKKTSLNSFLAAMAIAVDRIRTASNGIGMNHLDNGFKRSVTHRNTAKNKRLAKKRRNIAMYNK